MTWLWLVNALAYEAFFRKPEQRDRSRPVTVEQMRQARESLILRRVVNGGGRIAREYGLAAGLEQTARYADQCGADSAHLLIFDRDPAVEWDAKVYREQHTQGARSISVWGM
jgi:hypothetical protein